MGFLTALVDDKNVKISCAWSGVELVARGVEPLSYDRTVVLPYTVGLRQNRCNGIAVGSRQSHWVAVVGYDRAVGLPCSSSSRGLKQAARGVERSGWAGGPSASCMLHLDILFNGFIRHEKRQTPE